MGKRRGRGSKARDRNMLQAVALGLVTLPRYYEGVSSDEVGKGRFAIKRACLVAAADLGWKLRRSNAVVTWEIWRPRMSIPWRPATPANMPDDLEQWALQHCCREIMRVSILNEEDT
jgi:hypothetical protein